MILNMHKELRHYNEILSDLKAQYDVMIELGFTDHLNYIKSRIKETKSVIQSLMTIKQKHQSIKNYLINTPAETYTQGTYKQGELIMNYNDIVKILGLPMKETSSEYIDCYWYIYDKVTHTIATLYNWKNGSYIDEDYKTLNKWNVGGLNYKSMLLIEKIFGE